MRVGFSWATFYHTSESNVCCCRYYSCSNWKAPWHPSEFVKNCWHVFYHAHPQPNGEEREGGRERFKERMANLGRRVKGEEEKGGRRIGERKCFIRTHTHTHTHTHIHTQRIHTHQYSMTGHCTTWTSNAPFVVWTFALWLFGASMSKPHLVELPDEMYVHIYDCVCTICCAVNQLQLLLHILVSCIISLMVHDPQPWNHT